MSSVGEGRSHTSKQLKYIVSGGVVVYFLDLWEVLNGIWSVHGWPAYVFPSSVACIYKLMVVSGLNLKEVCWTIARSSVSDVHSIPLPCRVPTSSRGRPSKCASPSRSYIHSTN
jgi:hypothetical protein